MRYVLFTWVGERGEAEWAAMTSEERAAFIERHDDWFARHGRSVISGEQLGPPPSARAIRRRLGRNVITDGPFAETKELLGGYIVVDVADLNAALAMAGEWPSLATDGNAVEVRPALSSDRGPKVD